MLVTALARRSLWLTDAYFIGTAAYIEALRRAAHDGVDVRLLVPQYSDVGWTVPVARSLYRPLLEAGVRIFEWNGTMVHAKTAIADGRWARIGSTNLNINSWLGNWELDVAVEDEGVATELESHYLEDLRTIDRNRARRRSGCRPAGPARPTGRAEPSRRYRSSRRVVRAVTTSAAASAQPSAEIVVSRTSKPAGHRHGASAQRRWRLLAFSCRERSPGRLRSSRCGRRSRSWRKHGQLWRRKRR